MADLNRIEKMQEARRKRQEAGIPNKPPEHNLIKRYGLNSKSRKEAIFMMCFYCQGGDADVLPDPGWKREIRECKVLGCPLHKWRPYQKQ